MVVQRTLTPLVVVRFHLPLPYAGVAELADAHGSGPCVARQCGFKSRRLYHSCPSGGIGRRTGLKIRFPEGSEGSSPSLGTNYMRVWRNWQTRHLEGVVSVSSCGFESHYPHQSVPA